MGCESGSYSKVNCGPWVQFALGTCFLRTYKGIHVHTPGTQSTLFYLNINSMLVWRNALPLALPQLINHFFQTPMKLLSNVGNLSHWRSIIISIVPRIEVGVSKSWQYEWVRILIQTQVRYFHIVPPIDMEDRRELLKDTEYQDKINKGPSHNSHLCHIQ